MKVAMKEEERVYLYRLINKLLAAERMGIAYQVLSDGGLDDTKPLRTDLEEL